MHRTTKSESARQVQVKFTPGPWEFDFDIQALVSRPIWDEYRRTRASDPEDEMPDGIVINWGAELDYDEDDEPFALPVFELTEADANLIAAAPDLYEALKMALEHIEESVRGHDADEVIFDGYILAANLETLKAALAKANGEAQ